MEKFDVGERMKEVVSRSEDLGSEFCCGSLDGTKLSSYHSDKISYFNLQMDELEKPDASIFFIDEVGLRHPLPLMMEDRISELLKDPTKIVIMTGAFDHKGDHHDLLDKIT